MAVPYASLRGKPSRETSEGNTAESASGDLLGDGHAINLLIGQQLGFQALMVSVLQRHLSAQQCR